jgi:hypothetical protein
MKSIRSTLRLLPENDAKANRIVKQEQKTQPKFSKNEYINQLIKNDKR